MAATICRVMDPPAYWQWTCLDGDCPPLPVIGGVRFGQDRFAGPDHRLRGRTPKRNFDPRRTWGEHAGSENSSLGRNITTNSRPEKTEPIWRQANSSLAAS
jgi:hypothetical protein